MMKRLLALRIMPVTILALLMLGSFGQGRPMAQEAPVESLLVEIRAPTGPLTLADALSLALMGNPELQAYAWEIRARDALVLQAKLLPNPEIAIESENFGGTGGLRGFRGAETTISISQLLRLGGKRGQEIRAATLDRDLARLEYEILKADLLAEVATAFVRVLVAQERVRIAEEVVRVTAEELETVRRRVEAGAVTPVEETRAEVALAASEVERDRLERELSAARRRLSALWGQKEATFERAVGDLEGIPGLPELDSLLAEVEKNPRLAYLRTEQERWRAQYALERALRIPDLEVEGGIRRLADEGTQALMVGVSVVLPVLNRNQGAVRAARHALNRARMETMAEEVRISAELAATYEELISAYEELTTLREQILPRAQTAFLQSQEAFREGLFNLTDVLQARRTLYELRNRYVEVLGRYHEIRITIQRLIGQPQTAGHGLDGSEEENRDE
jgi:cobalt-zinc-cadmium efflux system outer membrane protein